MPAVFDYTPFYLLRQDVSLNLELKNPIQPGLLTRSWGFSLCLLSPGITGDCHTYLVFMGVLEFQTHLILAWLSPTEPSP